MSRAAKTTLAASVLVSAGIIWTVHFMQRREAEVRRSDDLHSACVRLIVRRQTMYQGVLRDEERRRDKMRQRQADFEESQRKRALYEQVQHVRSSTDDPAGS